ncbi:MAG: chiP-II [Gammaproteobacteria bacterium]|nr:chiP-II [Gammaproteobacteria bacterium]
MIGTAVAIALFGRNSHAADAPQGPTQSGERGDVEEIVVTGIRASVEHSLEAKREATSVEEVVSAEDIGKMPDKNVADSLTRVPGVTTSSASANEGGFDENDRVSMRGTNPSLTQTLVNGHGIAAGDWFVLNQVQQVGRSVSYTLLPSELVSKVVVHKSSQASLVEGGVAGSVDIITRKPLEFSKPVTLQASAGAVYADLPSKTDPQFSALGNWKNEAGNFGVMVQGFYEARHLRRDGVEILGYEQFAPGSPVVNAHPDLANVWYPKEVGAALFDQKRVRKGGLVDVQLKPTDALTFDLSAFYSKLDASNYNRNYLEWLTHYVNLGNGQGPDPGYVVTNGTLTKANFSPVAGTFYGVYDQISRPDESATAGFVNLDGEWRASDSMTFLGQVGTSKGDGKTPTQDVSETQPGLGTGAGYSLHGIGSAPDFNLGSQNNTTPFPGGTPVSFGWIFGAQNVDVKDKESWGKLDGDYKIHDSSWTDLKFGARYQTHERSSNNALAQGPLAPGMSTDHYPTTFGNYPGNFNSFGGSIPSGIWYWSPAQLAAYDGPGFVNRDPLQREYYQYLFDVKEKNSAAYVQAEFKGSSWAADVGVRYVRTQEHSVTYTQVTAATPGAITTSLFGPFIGIPVDHTYNDVLPSANLKFDITSDLVGRFAASETMTRADYSALAGFTDLSPPSVAGAVGSGSGGNPDLKPIRSTNFDAGLEWYFAKRSLLSATYFYMDLRNYIGFGSATKSYLTFSSQVPNGAQVPYLLTVPVNAKGRVQGLELAYQQALSEYFGLAANYTYADGKQTSLVTNGDDRLVGTSKNTFNVSGYFENKQFSARVAYTYRSAFFSGLDRNTAFSQDAIGSLTASLQYALNDMISLTLDGENLNNPTLKYYALNKDQPRAFYKNGAQYYLTLRAKF